MSKGNGGTTLGELSKCNQQVINARVLMMLARFVNGYGCGQHPWADMGTIHDFRVEYVRRCLHAAKRDALSELKNAGGIDPLGREMLRHNLAIVPLLLERISSVMRELRTC